MFLLPPCLQNDTCRFELACARCATSCEETPESVYVATEATIPVCVDLPEGTVAQSRGTNLATLSLAEGYYRTSAESREVLECYQADACVGGTAAQDNCASGYHGPCKCARECFCCSCSLHNLWWFRQLPADRFVSCTRTEIV